MKYFEGFFFSTSRRVKITLMLLLLSVFATGLFIMRALYTNDLYYAFLVWNLFLAWIPYVFAFVAKKNFFRGKNKISILGPACIWLLFFPNAPYIITDLIHIEPRFGIPAWFDAVLVFCFAFTGFILGLASLYFIHRILEVKFPGWISWLLVFLLIGMSGYGVYIGRILRWNSWDAIINTLPLLNELQDTALSISSIAMVVMFSVLMGITYPFLFYFVRSTNEN